MLGGMFMERANEKSAGHPPRVRVLLCITVVMTILVNFHRSVDAAESFRDHLPAFASLWNLTPGLKADYEVSSYGINGQCFVTLSIVGQETFKGKPAYWMEITSHYGNSSKQFIFKALFYIDGKDIIFPASVVQLPERPPMIVPDYWLFSWARGEFAMASGYIEAYGAGEWAMNPPARQGTSPVASSYLNYAPNSLPRAKEIGTETITTLAGTFVCQHWQFKAESEQWRPNGGPTDVWLAKGAGPFSIVKARTYDKFQSSTESIEMVLTHVTTAAKDQITAAPQKVQAMTLYYWLWADRNDVLSLCLPQLGLPVCCTALPKGYKPGD